MSSGNALVYRVSSNITLISSHPRPVIELPTGGRVALDRRVHALMEYTHGKNYKEIVEGFDVVDAERVFIPTAIACLVEAGLLIRSSKTQNKLPRREVGESKVSIVIVTHNDRSWLEICLDSIYAQTHPPKAIVIVDNSSTDGTADWIRNNHPQVNLIECDEKVPYARAVNRGMETINSEYSLILNPDVRLEESALAELMAVAKEKPLCAAVVPKLRLLHSPAFLNGLGNRVAPFVWGVDNGLGHLDLGQFDHWKNVPSACFAATLIPRSAWESVGPLDEGFPMYYEDSEWSYRARLLGYEIRVAPKSVVYHAFGFRKGTTVGEDQESQKIRDVTYGRLRFTVMIVSKGRLLRFLFSYSIADGFKILQAIIKGQCSSILAYPQAWARFIMDLAQIIQRRKMFRDRLEDSDADLFSLQRDMPIPLIWNGMPLLTWDSIIHAYYPVFASDCIRALPERMEQTILDQADEKKAEAMPAAILRFGCLKRAWRVLRHEGLRMFFWWTRQRMQWRLSRV